MFYLKYHTTTEEKVFKRGEESQCITPAEIFPLQREAFTEIEFVQTQFRFNIK